MSREDFLRIAGSIAGSNPPIERLGKPSQFPLQFPLN